MSLIGKFECVWETYAPLSTLMERMLSSPHSWMLQHSEVNSWFFPWKCSCSNTVTWEDNRAAGGGNESYIRYHNSGAQIISVNTLASIVSKYKCVNLHVFTLKKGAMPIPELTSGCIIGDFVVLYIFAADVVQGKRQGRRKRRRESVL